MPRSTGTRDGWVRSARLAFEKSAGRATASHPNLPYTRTNKRLHLALKKHADQRGRAARRVRRKSQRAGGGGEHADRCRLLSSPRPYGRTCGPLRRCAHARAYPHVYTLTFRSKSSERQANGDRADTVKERARGRGAARQAYWTTTRPPMRGLWIGTEVVDALGQTHLALKQLRHYVVCRSNVPSAAR